MDDLAPQAQGGACGLEAWALFCNSANEARACTEGRTRDKGDRREVQLTVQAMMSGTEAPIPFEEIVEVTEATFSIAKTARVSEVPMEPLPVRESKPGMRK